MKKTIIKTFEILLLSSLIGFLLLFLIYKLPVNTMKEHVLESFEEDDTYLLKRQILPTYKNSYFETFIDGVMIGTTIYDNKNYSTLEKSLNNYFIYNNITYTPIRRELEQYLLNNKFIELNYARYWHGYTLFLKPLLLFFNLFDIQIINYVFQTVLFVLICILMYKNKLQKYILAFVSSYMIMVPMFLYESLSLSSMLNLMLISSTFILFYYKHIKKENIKYVFLITGILSSYFDLLTFPLITIGYPIIFTLLLDEDDKKLEKVKKVIIYSILWIIGYFGMYIAKWTITSIFLKQNMFKDAFKYATVRISNEYKGIKISLLNIFTANLSYLINKLSVLIIAVNFIIAFIQYELNFIKSKTKKFNFKKIDFFPLILIALMPIVWSIFIKEHTYEHAYFTFRIFTITIFSIFILITNLSDSIEK